MKPFIIPFIFADKWDELDDFVTASEESTIDPREGFTTPPDEIG